MSTTTSSSSVSPNTSSPTPKLNSTQIGPYAVHAACVTEVNATLHDVPRYTGFTGEAKLADKQEKEGHEQDEEKGRKKCEQLYT